MEKKIKIIDIKYEKPENLKEILDKVAIMILSKMEDKKQCFALLAIILYSSMILSNLMRILTLFLAK